MENVSRRDLVKSAVIGGAGVALAGMAATAAHAEEAAGAACDYEADVVVIGGGAAGLMACAVALTDGASALLIEKAGNVGGSSMYAVGVQACWPERRVADGGAEDSPEQYLADWAGAFARSMKGMRGDEQPTEHPHAERFTQIWPEVGEFLSGPIGIQLDPFGPEGEDPAADGWLTTFCPGNELEPCTNPPVGRCWWNALPFTTPIDEYCSGFEGYTELLGCEATDLAQDESGRVNGVRFFDADGIVRIVRANKGVVLATGDFCSNPGMISQYMGSELASFETSGAHTCTGDGITMAKKIGAGLVDMDLGMLIQGTPDGTSDVLMFDHYTGNFQGREGALAGHIPGITVNVEGQRIIAESRGKADMMNEVVRQTQAIGYYISDATYDTSPYFDGCSLIYRADTIEELAETLCIDPAALLATVKRYNGFVDAGVDDDFAKEMAGTTRIETAPFWAIRLKPRPFVTYGGVATDADSRVLDTSGAPIEGLYAAGIVCGSYWEQEGLPYNGGFNQALAFGYQAGQKAAAEA